MKRNRGHVVPVLVGLLCLVAFIVVDELMIHALRKQVRALGGTPVVSNFHAANPASTLVTQRERAAAVGPGRGFFFAGCDSALNPPAGARKGPESLSSRPSDTARHGTQAADRRKIFLTRDA